MINTMILGLIKRYKKFVSPVLTHLFGGGCRYNPTCSDYSYQAFYKYGIIKGIILSVKRVSSCHPFSSKSTYDPLR